MTPGHIVHFKCELSDENKDFHVLWINTETQETFSNPLEVKLVALKQSWMCGRSQSHIFIIAGVFITFIFILIAMITAVCCTKTPEESLDSVTYAGVTFTKKSDPRAEW
ncbi:hypothetical protein Q7C36_018702 [Tachysurus vachellii]|uniref:Uncharacterized protein n=1 Tax=Tachysurus vachellii TaxID=175792 RepID=A0AA88M0H5_TACVA|nr:hypothetical protein Q7C36_018702 [Tachysurus vachellii]